MDPVDRFSEVAKTVAAHAQGRARQLDADLREAQERDADTANTCYLCATTLVCWPRNTIGPRAAWPVTSRRRSRTWPSSTRRTT
jgi:hypothetical protein